MDRTKYKPQPAKKLSTKLLQPITWAYAIAILSIIGIATVCFVALFMQEYYVVVSLVCVGLVIFCLGILMLTWIINMIVLFTQIRRGSGTRDQLERRIHDFNLFAAPRFIVPGTKLQDKWLSNQSRSKHK